VGAILTGVFAEKSLNGLFDGAVAGNVGQVGIQAIAVLTAAAYSGVATFVLLKLISVVLPLRASRSEEDEGLDISQHGEEAYLTAGGGSAMMTRTEDVKSPAFSPARSQA
jgi:Amt family ammonium transporter